MRKIYLLFFTVLISLASQAQNVTVSGALTGNGTYPDLGAAFTAINGGAQTGAIITVSIVGNTTESASAVLNANDWATLTISPSGGSARTISGNFVGHLIDLNGADNVTINGLNTGGNSLTISNAGLGASSTIRFIADASNNTVNSCTLAGSTTSFGVVTFSTGTVTGNDGNTIINNIITAAGSNFPTAGVYSLGTSAAIDNSSNFVGSNNIADVFSATSVFTGININSFNNAWVLINNRVYQTASRAVTTANTSSGILITSGNGHTITGNVIGFASPLGTGTMTYTSTVALRYIGINCAFATGAPASNIQGNTIASIGFTTSSGAATTNGVLCGINVTAGDANIGTITGNTIGATSGTGSLSVTSTTTQALIVGINSSSTGTISIQNNQIGGFTSSGTTAAVAGAIMGVNISGVAASVNISNNTIGNATADNMRGGTLGLTTGSSIVSGINLPSTPTTATISGNTIRNLTSYGTGTAGYVRGIWTALSASSTATGWTITGNTISNLLTNNATTGIGSGVCSALGIHHLSSQGCVISQNSISGISNINTAATTNIIVAGIMSANATVTTTLGTEITRNRIWNLSNLSVGTTALSPPMVVGIGVRSGNNITTITNNMISLGSGQTTNTSFIGIWSNNGSTPNPTSTNVYFNSVVIDGTATAGALPSFAYLRSQYISATANTVTVDVRNNVLQNNRTGGTGQHFAISNGFNATTVSSTGWGTNASNFNILNANAATVGHWTSAQNFAGWQGVSVSDINSLSGAAVSFVNAATADLHIASFPTPVEGTGVLISSVTVDYDNQTRASFSPTDIGADADNFFSYPVINYTPLANTCATGARTLTATITDADGVPTAGPGLPVLYWRINAGAYTAATATSLGGGQYQFSFGAGAAIGDVVSYYIAAQDNLGNAGTAPSFGASGFTTNPPAATTPPASPSSYVLQQTLTGTYTVGVGGNFTTLTAAAAAYNSSCLGGPVIFSLTDATYPSETFPITFNANADASAVNTLTVKAGAPAVSISGSSASAILVLNGTDFVTIDGSTSATANTVCPPSAATRNLTITNTNTSTSSAVVSIQTSPTGDPATNNRILNCVVSGNAPLTTGVGINISGPAIGSGVGANLNNNNQVVNNRILRAQVGIFSAGASVTTRNTGNVFNLNVMDGTVAAGDNIGRFGIMCLFEDGSLIQGNQIANIVNTASADVVAISVGANALTAAQALGAETINATISNNRIDNIQQTNTFSACGILVGPATSGTSLVSNNMISNVYANGTAGDHGAGIYVGGGTGSITNVYNNTVRMNAAAALTGGALPNAALVIGGPSVNPVVNLRNNILVADGPGNGSTINQVAIGLNNGAPFTNLSSNNNNFFVSGAGSHIGVTGSIASGTTATTLANWQTNSGGDAASQNVAPVFVSATDLHLSATPGVNWCLNGTGVTLAAVTNDIDCQAREAAPFGPDLGADEFTPTGLVINNPTAVCTPNTVDLTAAAVTSGSIGGLTFSYFTDAAATVPLSSPNAVAASGTYYIRANNGSCNLTLPVVVTINSLPATFNVTGGGSYCSGGAGVAVGLDGSESGVNYQLFNGAAPVGSPVAGSGSAISFGNQTAAGTYTVLATNAATFCTSTMNGSAIVAINPAPSSFNVTGGGSYCSGGSGVAVGLSGSESGVDYQLFNGASPVGSPVAGTGAAISFGSQSLAGTYTVVATNTTTTCSSTMNGSVTVTIDPLPTAFNVTGGGSYCSGGPGVVVGLSGSEAGVNYQLFNGAAPVGSPVAGTGSAISFGNQTATGTYSVIGSNTSTSCTSTMTGTVTVSITPLPVIGSVITQPTTCVSADGAVNLTISGGTGPYTYNWTTVGGTGLVAGQEDQSGLTIGQYTVVVTDQATGCQATETFNLIGPGSCAICPTMGALTAAPSASICENAPVTLTVSGLTSMGITYGIEFKYSTSPLADPYTGGTSIATIANGALGGGGTTASTSTSFVTAGTYYVYAILSPTPVDPGCRPSSSLTVTVNPNPTFTVGASPTVCAGTTSAPLPYTGSNLFTGSVVLYAQSGATTNGSPSQNFEAANDNFDCESADDFNVPNGQTWQVNRVFVEGTGNTANPVSFKVEFYSNSGGLPGSVIATFTNVTTFTNAGSNFTINLPSSVTLPGNNTYWVSVQANLDFPVGGQWFWSNFGATNIGAEYAWRNPGGGFATTCTNYSSGSSTCNVGGGVNRNNAFSLSGPGDPTYSIVWSGAALGQGFVNVTNATLPASPIDLVVPAGAAPGTYTGTITVTNGTNCSTSAQPFSVTVNPIPTVNAVANQAVCNGSATTAVSFTGAVPGTVYNWTNDNTSIGLAATGTGDIASFTATNSGTTPVTATITVTPSFTNNSVTCTGTPVSFTITVNPTPNAVATPASQTICSGTAITTIVLSGNVSGTTYNWTRDNTAGVTGIAASGSGNISGTLTNTTNAPVTVTFTITPTANGCPGAPITATVLVNPIPNAVATPASQTVCSGTAITTIVLSGNVSGTTYNWTRDNTAGVTGIAASGSGNISGTLTNTTNAPVTVTFTITPTANGCPGAPITATVLVNPTPNAVAAPTSQVICSGTTITPIVITGNVSGTTFNWTRNNTASVTGIAASGSGNISGTLTNTTSAPVTVTFTITPTANGCPGTPVTATVTVNPIPTVNPVANQTVCNGTPTAAINFTGPVAGTVYNWTNNTTSIGLGASGTGNIASFTAVNATTLPVTATITVTPSTATNTTALPELFYYNFNGTGTTVPNLASTPPAGTATATIVGAQTQGGSGICNGTLIGSGNTSTSNYVNTNWATNFSGPWTISFKTSNITPSATLFYVFGDNNAGNMRCFTNGVAGANNWILRGTGINDVLIPGGATTATNTNTFVYDNVANVIRAYLNGTLVATVTQPGPISISGAGPFKVGGQGANTGLNTGGLMDEFRIYNRALSGAEVSGLTACPAAPLVCTGPPQSFTITVNPTPTITCPANISTTTPAGSCTATVTYTPTITGTPAPNVTYTFSGATTGSGNGTGSGSAFNIGTTTVTVTASNVCGTVSCSFTVTVADGQLPVITAQPANRTVCAGSNATFSVTAITSPNANGPLSYQWQAWNGSAWVDISGATAATFTVNNAAVSQNNTSYRVRVIGLCTTIISNHATLQVNPNPTVSITPSIPPALIPGQNLTLTAQPNPAGGGSYQWQLNGSNIAGATSQTLDGITVDRTGLYRVIYTDANGCVGTSASLEVTAKQSDNLWVYPNPNRGIFNIRFFNRVGEEVTVRLFDTKGALVYQQKVLTTAPYTNIQVNLTNQLIASESYVVEIRDSQGVQVGAKRILVYR